MRAMPRLVTDTRSRIIEVAYELFYAGGFNRAGVDAIAAAAGVTKRTLYYHFASKDDLLTAVLEIQHELALESIRRWADKALGQPKRLIDTLFGEFADWASQPKWKGSGFTRIVMELADMPGHPARAMASRHKLAVEALLSAKLGEAGAPQPRILATQIMLLLEGCLSLVLIHGETRYVREAAVAAKALLLHQERDGG